MEYAKEPKEHKYAVKKSCYSVIEFNSTWRAVFLDDLCQQFGLVTGGTFAHRHFKLSHELNRFCDWDGGKKSRRRMAEE